MTTCRPTAAARRRAEFNEDERSYITVRREQFEAILRSSEQMPRAVAEKAAQQQAIEAARRMLESRYTSLTRILPHQNKRLQDFLATMFGQKGRFLGLDPNRNYTVAGNVRHSLLDVQQTTEGMVSLTSRVKSLQAIDNLVNGFRATARDLNISAEQTARLLDDTLTVGQIPRNMSNLQYYRMSNGMPSPSLVFNQKRYDAYVQAMLDAGFTQQQTNSLINRAALVTQAFDEVRMLALAAGVDIPDMENLGYFTRIATKDFQLRLADVHPDELLENIRVGTTELSTVYARTRSTFHYIPEDAAFTARLLDISGVELQLLLDEPLTWRSFLHENLSIEQLETLADSGVLTKLPMSSTEVFEYFVKQFELPYTEINQMWITDPNRAIDTYSRSLMQAAGNASLVRSLVDNRAISAGWAITDAEYLNNRELYSNFVSLGNYLDRWAKQAGIEVSEAIQRMGLATNIDAANEFFVQFSSMRVHPVVAHQWSAIMEVSMNPSMMGLAGQFAYRLGRVMNKTILGLAENFQYITRTALGGMMSAMASGMNLNNLMPAFFTVTRVLTEGTEFLDNVRPFRKDGDRILTEREFVEDFFIKRGQGMTPGVTRISVPTLKGSVWSDFGRTVLQTPFSTWQAFSDIASYTLASPNSLGGRTIPPYERIGRLSRATTQKISNFIDYFFEAVAVPTNILDMTFKLASYMSVTRGPSGETFNRIGQVLSSFQLTNFDDLESARRHLDEYFVNVYDTGRVTHTLANFVFPFMQWRLANPPIQLRHMFRKPALYQNYLRLAALMQEDMEEQPEAVYPGWVLETIPLQIGRDDRGRPFTLIPNSFDPVLDAFVFFRESTNAVQRILFGQRAGTQYQRRAMARGEVDGFITDIFASTYPYIKVPAEQLFGIDTFTGRRFDSDPLAQQGSILGIKFSPRWISLLRNIPGVNQLDELNPGGVFGTPTRRDIYGNATRLGTPSWTGAERTRRDTDDYPAAVRMLRAMGLNIRRIDYDEGLNMTLRDVENTIDELESGINFNSVDLRNRLLEGVIDQSEYNRRVSEIRDATLVWGQLRFDALRVRQYMISERNLVPEDVLRELRNRRIAVSGLPHPAQNEIDAIVEQALTWENELVELERQYGTR